MSDSCDKIWVLSVSPPAMASTWESLNSTSDRMPAISTSTCSSSSRSVEFPVRSSAARYCRIGDKFRCEYLANSDATNCDNACSHELVSMPSACMRSRPCPLTELMSAQFKTSYASDEK